jgi:signal transduction histidine kinase/ligand-binding sensor domain-containing protein/DNA-binding response OmpR family regulator
MSLNNLLTKTTVSAVLLLASWCLAADIQKLQFDRIGIEEGLSQGSVITLMFDDQGWLWVGTEDGVNRYDGYNFRIFRHDPVDPDSLGSAYVLAIFKDSQGAVWVGTEGGGLNRLNQTNGKFDHFLHNPDDQDSLIGDYVSAIFEDRQGRLWVGTSAGISRLDKSRQHFTNFSSHDATKRGLLNDQILSFGEDRLGNIWVGTEEGLYRFIESDQRFIRYAYNPLDDGSIGGQQVRNIFEDQSGRLWISTFGGQAGLSLWDPEENRFRRFAPDPDDEYSMPSTDVNQVTENPDEPGVLWIGTRTAGLVRFDTNSGRFYANRHDPGQPSSISNDRVSSVVFDNTGTLWAGAYDAGLNRLHRRHQQWTHYSHDPEDQGSLPNAYVRSIAESDDGTLWIGTYDGGLARLGPDRSEFFAFQHDPSDPGSIGWNEVRNVYVDHSGTVWAGTYHGGLNRLDEKSGSFTRFLTDPTDLTSISDNRVLAIQEDGRGTLWVGTDRGLNRFQPDLESFQRYRSDPDNPNSLSSETIYALYTDSKGQLWIATLGGGMNRYDPETDSFVHYRHDRNDPTSLVSDSVLAITEDSKGRIWVGTLGGGLDLLDQESGTFSHHTTAQGLPNNVIHGIVEDDEGRLWLSTNNGLARFEPETGEIRNYSVGDGLLTNEFSAKAYHRTQRGELAFGSLSGLTLFTPDLLEDNPVTPPVYITDFKLLGKSVTPGAQSVLTRQIEETTSLVLTHRDSVISFEFTALDFVAPQNNQYAYLLEGFDQGWQFVNASQRVATYTNLDAGDYTFRVRASNSDGVWNNQGQNIQMTVLPPPWRSWWAYSLYALMLMALFIVERRRTTQQIELRAQIDIERLETEKLKEVDHLKSKFFANISHEFRTPLTLILGPLKALIGNGVSAEQLKQLQFMEKNANRLHRLVNQLFDLSRLKSGRLTLQQKPGDLVDYCRGLSMSFFSLAEINDIQLDFNTDSESAYVYFDAERIETMLVNLISNALKFTPKNGRVAVSLKLSSGPTNVDPGRVWFELIVSDTGIGIPIEYQGHVFDRFYQVDSSDTRGIEGAGIGLALVKELAELHGGAVRVNSTAGGGSTFCLLLGFSKCSAKEEEEPGTLTQARDSDARDFKCSEKIPGSTGENLDQEDETIVLLVEDNDDLRAFICDRFSNEYSVIEAENGRAGLELAYEKVPDLIISDVMMPEMDGFSMCHHLKTDHRTSHIPIIMLTAKASQEEKFEGLELGADAYLSKPFDSDELLARARNLIEQRRLLRQSFSGTIVLQPHHLELGNVDQSFLSRALMAVEADIDDEDFSVEVLAEKLNLSRSQLHRKLKALTNQTPTSFIRTIRLERAAQLLKQDYQSIADIALQTGFSSQAYFTKCFHDHFGCTPSEYNGQAQSTRPEGDLL